MFKICFSIGFRSIKFGTTRSKEESEKGIMGLKVNKVCEGENFPAALFCLEKQSFFP